MLVTVKWYFRRKYTEQMKA